MNKQNKLLSLYHRIGNVNLIVVGLIIGIIVGYFAPGIALKASILGELFIKALMSVAPILIFILVVASIARHQKGRATEIKSVLMLYIVGTFAAAVLAVIASALFPTKLILEMPAEGFSPPQGIMEVFKGILLNAIDNPINALLKANFVGILIWAIAFGIALNRAHDTTKGVVDDLAESVSIIVRWVIRFAPIGIFGIVASTIAREGLQSLSQYVDILLLLLGSMAVLGLVINPLIVFLAIRKNPYPLVFTCLRESGISAFLTRSSAANIPVNIAMCEKMGLDKNTYSISIPLGATINMGGAAITITILTLAAVHTLGIEVSLMTAFLLSIIATLSACGASGVAGGSLLLIPLACSLFGIPTEVAMQVIAVGFTIGVLQDSTETMLNSSTDLLFTATACIAGGKVNQPDESDIAS